MSVLVAVTQRVVTVPAYHERRDALDQRWVSFLAAAGLVPLPVPNNVAAALSLVETAKPEGLVLTGGNDIAPLGGDAPERDETEQTLVAWAQSHHLPVIGICRGFQMLVHLLGGDLAPISGHVARPHSITLADQSHRMVNSFHNWGISRLPSDWQPFAWMQEDGSIEAARDITGRQLGLMWHPERAPVSDPADIYLFRTQFRGSR